MKKTSLIAAAAAIASIALIQAGSAQAGGIASATLANAATPNTIQAPAADASIIKVGHRRGWRRFHKFHHWHHFRHHGCGYYWRKWKFTGYYFWKKKYFICKYGGFY